MNIATQACGLIILAVIAYISMTHRNLGVFQNQLFRGILFVDIAGVAMDILSVLSVSYKMPEIVKQVSCKSYLILMLALSYLLFLYIRADSTHVMDWNGMTRANRLILEAGTVCILISGLDYQKAEDTWYTIGTAVVFFYLFTLWFTICSIASLCRVRNIFPPKKIRACSAWVILWLMGTFAQCVWPVVYTISFATALGCVILFFELENPESNTDRITGLFNRSALIPYLNYLKDKDIMFGVVLVGVTNAHEIEDSGNDLKQHLVAIMNGERRGASFCYSDNDYVYVYRKDRMDAEDTIHAARTMPDTMAGFYSYVVIKDTEHMDIPFLLQELCAEARREDTVKVVTQKDYEEMVDFYKTEQMISRAIEDDRVVIYLQPIYGTKQKHFVSAEVLVRILGEDGNLVPPGAFIPVAEQTGQVAKIGDIVFRKACEFMQEHPLDDLGLEYLEVNLSVRNGENPKLWQVYRKVLEDHGVRPDQINLEITETDTVRQKNCLLDNMAKMIESGVSFSLDDFGSGRSNMDYLREMPVSIVKFDKDMTQNFFVDDVSKIILYGTLGIIQELGKKTVSEGVETEEHLKQMSEMGIDYIQGYYFSKPLPEDEFVEFIKKGNAEYLKEKGDTLCETK